MGVIRGILGVFTTESSGFRFLGVGLSVWGVGVWA